MDSLISGIFGSIFKLATSSKKVAAGASALAFGSSAVYFGIIKPNFLNKKVSYLEGSTPQLGSGKGNPYKFTNNSFFVRDFSNFHNAPSLSPALSRNYLERDTGKRYVDQFSPEIRDYIFSRKNNGDYDFTNSTKVQVWSDKFFNQNNTATTLTSATSMRRLAGDFSFISDIEIPNKSYLFLSQTNRFTKNQIIEDLIWSLVDESEANRTIIRPGSIKIDFFSVDPEIDLSKTSRRDFLKIPSKKLQNFEISFKIFNPNHDEKTVYRFIKVDSQKEVEISVKINEAELRPFAFPSRLTLIKGTSWGLVPLGNSEFNIRVRELFPRTEEKYISIPRLQLIYGVSRFLSESTSNYSTGYVGLGAINLPTYGDFLKVAQPLLTAITADEIKKDLETWYGSYYAYLTRMSILDIKKLLNMLNLRIVKTGAGTSVSTIEQFLRDEAFRTNIYTHIRLDENIRAVTEPLFDTTGNQESEKITEKNMTGFIKTLAKKMDDIVSNTNIKLNWEQEPTIGITDEDDGFPYPTVSFKLNQTISFTNDITIPFKGCWDDTGTGTFIDSTDNCTGDKKYSFDFSKHLSKLKDILAPVSNMISGNVLGVSIFDVLIPDASKYIGWDKWEIKKDEEVKNTYEAVKSPIRPSIANNPYMNDEYALIPGWKAMDISYYQDFSKFKSFFEKIYSKISEADNADSVQLTQNDFSLSSLLTIPGKVKGEIKNHPLSTIIHLVNLLFNGPGSQKSTTQSTPEQQPWKTFFDHILQKSFKFDSVQLFVGFPRSFFSVQDCTTSNTTTHSLSTDWTSTTSTTSKCTKHNDVFKFPATIKNKGMHDIVSNFYANYSQNYPKAPVVFEFKKLHKWVKFLNNEGSTTVGFIRHLDKVRDILSDNFHYKVSESWEHKDTKFNHFPERMFIDWDKVKISVVPLDIEGAIKSVLNLKNAASSMSLISIANINISNLLGQSIQRDFLFVSVNMMLPDGSIFMTDKPIRFSRKSPYSTYQFGVNINFDKSKLELGHLKGKL